jgi:uncharacterized protein YggE
MTYRVGFVVLAGVLALAATACTGSERIAASGTPGQFPAAIEGLSVTGVGRVRGKPDTLRGTVGVEVTRPSVQEALDVAAAAVERVLAALRQGGVADEDIQTRELAVEPRYDYPENRAPVITGYIVRNLVEARLRDLGRVGEVLDAAVRAGGDDARLQGIVFSLEDNEELLDAARAAAFESAKAKAGRYAELAGAELGRLLSLEEIDAEPPPPTPYAEESTAGSIPVEPGSQDVTVRVTARWELG